MKVLLVDIEFDYGQKQRGLNTIRQLGYQAGMEKTGHNIIPFFYDDYINDRETLQKKLLEATEKHQPDLIFFILFKDQFKPETLDQLKSRFTTVNWFGDDTWRFEDFTRRYAPHFTHCITTDKYSLPKYKDLGIENVILSQWAAIENAEEAPFSGSYEFDVSFIGAHNSSRAYFIKQLQRQGIEVDCFGFGWPKGPVSNQEMNRIFRHSKINLNLSNSVNYDIQYLLSSPKNLLHSLRSKKLANQIKARNFEIPFVGGFQLTNYCPSLEDYFHIGQEVACYATLQDAVTQIQYFLKEDSARESLRKQGQDRARNEHGYSHRFQKIFEVLRP
jgi:spore maturation protein CgeB